MEHHSRVAPLCRFTRALTAAVFIVLAASSAAVTEGDQAPGFDLRSLQGDSLRLENYRGQIVVINFWASWCGPCKLEAPALNGLHQRFAGDGFTLLGINVEGTEAPARQFVDTIPVTFPMLIDVDQMVSARYRLETLPSTLVLDREGRVRYIHRGYKAGDEAEYAGVVEQLMGE